MVKFLDRKHHCTHITDSHRDDIKYNCPICNDKTFNSQGGYYKHLHVKHNLSHSGVKISDINKGKVPMDLGKHKCNENKHPDTDKPDEVSNMDGNKGDNNDTPHDSNKRKLNDNVADPPTRKKTCSSGPTSWDCPLCEDKKYVIEDEYYKHLYSVHNINRQGNKVPQKKDAKPKIGKSKKK